MTRDLRRAALYYAGRYGWAVLPCEPSGKKPLTEHGVKDASRDAETINRWWRTHATANIGLALGEASGVVALDVDDLDALRDLVAEHGPLPETVCSTTGRGQHYLFRCPEGGLRTRTVGPGLQLRGDGSYIVVPPSVHPSGKQYEWELSPDEVELAELPAWLSERQDRAEREPLRELPDRIPYPGRNNTLTAYGGLMRRYGFSQAAIEAALLEVNRDRCDPPLPDDEVRRIAGSVARYQPEAAPVLSPNGQTGEASPLRELDAADLATADLPAELPSLPLLSQDGYVIEGWSHLVAGYPKAGKTELVYACVREWVRAGRSVLWLTEESELVWAHRLRRDPALPRGLRLVFGLGERPDRLLDRAMRGDEPVVVIDTIRSLLGIADEADNAEIARVVGQWESALRGKTRLYVHHLRKGLGDHGLAVAGGTMLVGAVDRVLELRHDEHDSGRRVLRVISRIVGASDLLLGLDSDGWPVALGDPAAVELERVMAACLDVLEPESWLKTGEVRDRLPEPKPSHR
ncbi:bifunctional DNA primase/polymerase, partial [Thermomicrobiaceae bacterium CFH 74404]